ncbi:MAG: PaaI family thioesterase [Ktedonobacteraceae bacterium]|nr:PaaI family thioesterase [Ktedonobacteraceae bacterium]
MQLNDTTDYQRCFACGQQNSAGLKMHFYQDGETIVSDFQPREEHQGFPGVIHGGIIATIFDEALNRTSMLAHPPAWSTTGKLEIRYRRFVPYGPLLRVRARLTMQRGRMIQASGTLTPAHDESEVLAEAQGSFMALKAEVLDEVMKDFPGMRAFFENQDRHEE